MSHETSDLRALGEFGLIARLQSNLRQRNGVQVGIGDDAAVLEALQAPLVTCDCLVESVHFRRDWTTPRQLGMKSLAVNISDIAAMGGRPVAAFITLALGPNDDLNFVDELYRGLEEVAVRYGISICGGDTSRSPSALMISITLIGESPRDDENACPVLRSGARPGDMVLVTGTLGDAAAGLALLQNPSANVAAPVHEYLLARHHEPQVRLDEMYSALGMPFFTPEAVANTTQVDNWRDSLSARYSRRVRAALDISDGLAGDAAHIARSSNVSIETEAARLPISGPCREAADALQTSVFDWALSGGEDYELLWCVAPDDVKAVVEDARARTGTMVSVVGQCSAPAADAVVIRGADGQRIDAAGAWTHF